MDEAVWQNAKAATDFWQYFPSDSVRAEHETEIYFLFDDKFLYVGAKCYAAGDQYIVPSLKRDFRAGANDNLSLLFDPFNDGTNAFLFGINPLGVRREALISEGGGTLDGFSTAWDNKWDGTAAIGDGYWSCELAIPFKTLRFNEGSQQWRFNSYRFDTQSNEQTTWVRIPRNQWIFNLAFMGDMIWEEPLKKSGPNVALIPYASSSYVQDFEEKPSKAKMEGSVGGDAKIALTPGLNLDLTFNPDFSQVEVDRQVTNLSRFEIFFPERRQFFTENADLFGGFGFGRSNPFFSRRIGIVEDTASGNNIQNRILYGARLNGKVGEDWRVGLLNMTTERDSRNGLPTFNYTVAAVQKKVFARSNVGFIFVNKEAFNPDSTDLFDPYNRILGFDYNLASVDNKWTGKTFLHKAFTTGALDDQFSHGLDLEYTVNRFQVGWTHSYIGENYDAQVGFVPRKNIFTINPEFRLFFYPRTDVVNQIEIGAESRFSFKPGFGKSDNNNELELEVSFQNNASFRVNLQHEYTYLFDPFDPTRTDSEELPANTDYNYGDIRISYSSDRRKKIGYWIAPAIGPYFNGMRTAIRGNISYRFQTLGSASVDFNYNYIDLPKPYARTSLFLIGPRLDLTFSKTVFFSALTQYNSQTDNLNINARFQWRFKPVSDFFLVYTDNYDTMDFGIKNRSLVAKVTYWLNM